jgi:hypothetical protein
VEVVDLDHVFPGPQRYARIIGRKGEKASSSDSTMVVNNMFKNPKKTLGRKPLYRKNKYDRFGGKTELP